MKILFLSSFYLTPFVFCIVFEESVEKMVGDSTSMVKTINPHPLKIDVVIFNGKNNFGM